MAVQLPLMAEAGANQTSREENIDAYVWIADMFRGIRWA